MKNSLLSQGTLFNRVPNKVSSGSMAVETDIGGCVLGSPLRRRVGAVERILELYDVAVLLLELPVVLHVVLHQLGQRGKLLAAIQVVVVARVLDLDVGDGAIPPARGAHLVKGWAKSEGRVSVLISTFRILPKAADSGRR